MVLPSNGERPIAPLITLRSPLSTQLGRSYKSDEREAEFPEPQTHTPEAKHSALRHSVASRGAGCGLSHSFRTNPHKLTSFRTNPHKLGRALLKSRTAGVRGGARSDFSRKNRNIQIIRNSDHSNSGSFSVRNIYILNYSALGSIIAKTVCVSTVCAMFCDWMFGSLSLEKKPPTFNHSCAPSFER